MSSKSSRLLDLRACSLSLKCFFLIISAKRVVSCIAGASRGFLVPELLRDLLGDLLLLLTLLLCPFLSCPTPGFFPAKGDRSLSLRPGLLSLSTGLLSLLFLAVSSLSLLLSLLLLLLGGVPLFSTSQSSPRLLLAPGSGERLGEAALLLLEGEPPRLLSSWSGVWPLASWPSGVRDLLLEPPLLLPPGLYLRSGLYLLLLL